MVPRMYVRARARACARMAGRGVGSVHQGDYNISLLQMEAGK